jgi:hypothetical protein
MPNGDSQRSTPTVKPANVDRNAPPERNAPAPPPRSPRRGPSPPQSRVEAKLRARVDELEARVSEITRCLEGAEHAAEVARSEARQAQQTLEMIKATRSWQMTAPLRSGMGRVRRMLRR